MRPCHAFVLCVLVCSVATTRFGRNEARCLVFCGGRDSEECRTCNSRIPMRFGKRSARIPHLFDLGKEPDVRLLAIIAGQSEDSDESYNEDK